MRARWCIAIAVALVACAGDDDDGRATTAMTSVTAGDDGEATTAPASSTSGVVQTDGGDDDDGATLLTSGLEAGDSSETGESGAPLRPGWAADVEPLVLRRCQGNCHLPGWSLVMSQGMGHAHLIDVQADAHPSMVRVAPGDLDNSFMWHKLNGTHIDVGGEGDMMPKVGAPLNDDELAIVAGWIMDGAAP